MYYVITYNTYSAARPIWFAKKDAKLWCSTVLYRYLGIWIDIIKYGSLFISLLLGRIQLSLSLPPCHEPRGYFALRVGNKPVGLIGSTPALIRPRFDGRTVLSSKANFCFDAHSIQPILNQLDSPTQGFRNPPFDFPGCRDFVGYFFPVRIQIPLFKGAV